MAVIAWNKFQTGYRLINGTTLNNLFTGAQAALGFVTKSLTVTGFQVGSVATGLTAHAGGGQTNALLLAATFNQISTVATTADSVKLPPSVAGYEIQVVNSGANSMQIFGSGTDTINGAAYATGVAVAAGKTAIFTCYAAGAWVGPVALA